MSEENAREQGKRWYRENKERHLARMKEWRRRLKEEEPERWRELVERNIARSKKWRATSKGVYGALRRSAHKQGREVRISCSEFVAWWEGRPRVCHYCGRRTEVGRGLKAESLDRKDNERTYSLDNIVISCKRCNLMKGSWLSYKQMLDAGRRYFKGE